MEHGHDHGSTLTRKRLVLSISMTFAFVGGEAIAGYFAHSLALMSDAGHNFADALALASSWYGIWIARKPSTSKRTFGYHRVGILAALINAVSLVVIALLIFWEAVDRFRHPERIESTPMIVLALIAVLMNTVITLLAEKRSKERLERT
jgi:cobalt-zinc-cadmium efflux system protein